MPIGLRNFFKVLAGTASVLACIYLGMTLILGKVWIDDNSVHIFTHGLYWFLVPSIFWALLTYFRSESEFRSPKVKYILDGGILIVEPCEWLGYRTTVSVFKLQDDVEQFVFSAYVLNIQSNRMVQIEPMAQVTNSGDIQSLKESKEKLLIKPGQIHE